MLLVNVIFHLFASYIFYKHIETLLILIYLYMYLMLHPDLIVLIVGKFTPLVKYINTMKVQGLR